METHMNREQRRRQQKHPGMTAEPLQRQQSCSIDYGHNGQMVVAVFSAKIQNLMLNEQQVDGMIEGLQKAKSALMLHKAAAAREEGTGHG